MKCKWLFAIAALLATVPAQADETPEAVIEKIDGLQNLLNLLVADPLEAVPTSPEPDVKINVTGAQWAWSYEYLTDDGAQIAALELVVPVDQVTQVVVTSTDVIHEFSIPTFGVKIDAVPGLLSLGWFEPKRVGTYFGQCSPLCGSGSADMVIAVQVVSDEHYTAWLQGNAR